MHRSAARGVRELKRRQVCAILRPTEEASSLAKDARSAMGRRTPSFGVRGRFRRPRARRCSAVAKGFNSARQASIGDAPRRKQRLPGRGRRRERSLDCGKYGHGKSRCVAAHGAQHFNKMSTHNSDARAVVRCKFQRKVKAQAFGAKLQRRKFERFKLTPWRKNLRDASNAAASSGPSGTAIAKRQRGDSNPCVQSTMDFWSITLTTRSRCQRGASDANGLPS